MMNIPANRDYRSIRLLLTGLPEWLEYDITLDTEERLRLELEESDPGRYLFLRTGLTQGVWVSRPDIQAVNFMRDWGAYRKRLRPYPRFAAWLRGRTEPISHNLGESIRQLADLGTAYMNKIEFLRIVDDDGEEVYLNQGQLMLLDVVDDDDRENITVVREEAGDFADEEMEGRWTVQVWQDVLDESWYGNVEFSEADECAPGIHEFDPVGPYGTKAKAISAIEADFGSGRYGNRRR